jgi:hypothetical protein
MAYTGAVTEPILNLKGAPDDPIERLIWLGGVKEQVEAEMNYQWQEAYFWARFTGRLDAALNLGLHSRKRVMAYTRAENEHRARMIRWGDGR